MGRRGGRGGATKSTGVTRKRPAEDTNTLHVTGPTAAVHRLYKERKIDEIPISTTPTPIVNMQCATPSETMTETLNGALTHTTTDSARLDLFYTGFVRGAPKDRILKQMTGAWKESPLHTLGLLLHSRDCRGGKGEKLVSYMALIWLRQHKPATYLLNLATFIDHGYFKDLLTLATMVRENKLPLLGEKDCIELEIFAEILKQDMEKVRIHEAGEVAKVANETAAKEVVENAAAAATGTAKEETKSDEWVDVSTDKQANITETTIDVTATGEISVATKPASIKPKVLCLSLAGKWAPSERGSHDKSDNMSKRLATLLFPNEKQPRVTYRKTLSKLRTYLNVVEKLMCTGHWDAIEFAKVPSKAHNLLKKAFQKHEAARYAAYLGAVVKGEAKINTTGLQPHELVQQYLSHKIQEVDLTIEMQWRTMVEKLKADGGLTNVLSLCDVSGSMTCNVGGSTRALDVCIAMGLFTSELVSEPFKNRILTFSAIPQWHIITGDTLKARVDSLSRAHWENSTNILSAFKMILDTAVEHKVKPQDLPATVIIYSDMQFDQCDRNFTRATAYDTIKQMYREAGYTAPQLVYWNINGKLCADAPVKCDTPGVALISGFSAELLKIFMKPLDFHPLNIMLAAIEPYFKNIKIDEYERNN